MADMDGFREANNFGFGQTSQFDNFHVKGASNYSWGMKDRLSRIFNPKTGRAVMLAFDHGFIMGPTSGLERIDLNIVPLVQYADCIMCTRGARTFNSYFNCFKTMFLCRFSSSF